MNSAVLKPRSYEDRSSIPPPLTSLSGTIEFGREPRLKCSPTPAATWPEPIRVGAL
jgi:hypothetical protein